MFVIQWKCIMPWPMEFGYVEELVDDKVLIRPKPQKPAITLARSNLSVHAPIP